MKLEEFIAGHLKALVNASKLAAELETKRPIFIPPAPINRTESQWKALDV